MSEPIPKLSTLLGRGVRKRCPHCGRGVLFQRWIKLHDRCSVCGLQYLPNQGDLWGPLVFFDRVLFIIPLIVLIYFRIWHPNWMLFFCVGGAAVFLLMFTMPHRLGMSLAVDYWIRRKWGDLAEPESAPPP
jgi:uncharacterized protein (DUF983 family)